MHRIKTALGALIPGIILSGCAAFTEHRTGLQNGELKACPEWPRCVNSDSAYSEKKIEPLRFTGDVDAAWQAARDAVSQMPRTEIVKESEHYLHAEVISPWHFYTDDLELHMRPAENIIAIRSSGRIGYFDFHVNRDRVEALRADLAKRGVVKAANP